jgi:hypothetical protein
LANLFRGGYDLNHCFSPFWTINCSDDS